MRKFGIRIGIVLAIVAFYFFLLRPLRAELNAHVYGPIVDSSIKQNEFIYTGGEASSVSNSIIWGEESQYKNLSIKVPLGLEFLIGLIGLVLVGSQRAFYFYLLAIQVFGSLLALLFLFLGSLSSIQLLVISDLLVRYLIPLCSLGIVPLAFIFQRQFIHEKKA